MNKLARRFISIFFSAIFFFVSGPGQLIHVHFHDHSYMFQTDKASSALNTTHTYCGALQLTLPEFFQAVTCNLQDIAVSKNECFANIEPDIRHIFSFNNSDRAPPVLV